MVALAVAPIPGIGDATAFGGEAGASAWDAVVFGSRESGAAAFTSAGVKIAPQSPDSAGPAGLLTAGSGMRYRSVGCTCTGRVAVFYRMATAALSPGYQWAFGSGVVAILAGPEVTYDWLPKAGWATQLGMRVQAEAWIRPTEATLFQGSFTVGTTRSDLWVRMALGYQLDAGYIGPEIGAYTDASGYKKASIGLHLTDLSILQTHFRISAGAQWTTGVADPNFYVAVVSWSAL